MIVSFYIVKQKVVDIISLYLSLIFSCFKRQFQKLIKRKDYSIKYLEEMNFILCYKEFIFNRKSYIKILIMCNFMNNYD